MTHLTRLKLASFASLCVGIAAGFGVGFGLRPDPAKPGPLSGFLPDPIVTHELRVQHPIIMGDKATAASAQAQTEKLFDQVKGTIRSSYADKFPGTLPTFFTAPREIGLPGLCSALAINLYTSVEPSLTTSQRFLVTADLSRPLGPQPKYKSPDALEQARLRKMDCAGREPSPGWFVAPNSATAWEAATLVAHLVAAARAGVPLPYPTTCPAYQSAEAHCHDIPGALARIDPRAIAGVNRYFSLDYPRSTENLVIEMQDKGGSYYQLQTTRRFIARSSRASPEEVSTRVELTSYMTPIID